MDSVHRDGRIWNISMMLLLLAFPVAVWIAFGEAPDWTGVALGLVATAPMYWAVGVVEVFTFIPMLGAGGSYLSFVTGNISNLKLPCAINALENAKVDVKSEEGEIISTIAIAVSSIVTTLIIILGVILITPLTPILNAPVLEPAFAQLLPALFGGLGVVFVSKNWKIAIAPVILIIPLKPILSSEVLKPAFDQMLPALFGALGVALVSKNWKIAIAPVALMLILFIFVPALNASTVGIMVPVGVIFTIAASRILYKKGIL